MHQITCPAIDRYAALCANLNITSYTLALKKANYEHLRYMSHVTYGNPDSAVIRHGFPWKSGQKFADHLWRTRGIVFQDSRNCVSESMQSSCGNRAPTDSSGRSPPNNLQKTAGYRVCEVVFGSLRIVLWKLNFFRNPRR